MERGNLTQFDIDGVVGPFVDLKRSRCCGFVVVGYLIPEYMILSTEVFIKKVLLNTLVEVEGKLNEDF